MSELRRVLERRALGVLIILQGIAALLDSVYAVYASATPAPSLLLLNVLGTFVGLAGIAALAALASYVTTAPARRLARCGLALVFAAAACQQAGPLVLAALPPDDLGALETLGVVFEVLAALGQTLVLVALALGSRGGARALILALAALRLAVSIVAFAAPDALPLLWRLLYDVLPIAAYAVRWRALAAPTDDGRADGPTDWSSATSGARILRTAVILQIVVVAGAFLFGLLAGLGQSSVFNLLVALLAIGGAAVVVALNLVGLGRLAKIPWASEARAPFSAAFQLTLLNAFAALVLLVTMVLMLARPRLLEDPTSVVRALQSSMATFGLAAGAALLFALRRVGIRLNAPRLRSLAMTTLGLQFAAYVPTAVLEVLQAPFVDATPSSTVALLLGLVTLGLGIAGWACLLAALREAEAALSGSRLVDALS